MRARRRWEPRSGVLCGSGSQLRPAQRGPFQPERVGRGRSFPSASRAPGRELCQVMGRRGRSCLRPSLPFSSQSCSFFEFSVSFVCPPNSARWQKAGRDAALLPPFSPSSETKPRRPDPQHLRLFFLDISVPGPVSCPKLLVVLQTAACPELQFRPTPDLKLVLQEGKLN